MEAIADKVIGLLGSLAYEELCIICNLQDDVESMKSMVTAIKALLLDAEKKASNKHAPRSELINDWLQKLKNVLLDAEDLLDAYYADELAREVMTKGKMGKEVRIFFSKSNRIVCATKLGHEIKALRKKLDGISNDMKSLHLSEISSIDESNYEWRQTHSFVREEDVIGRDNERMQLVGILLNPPDDVNVSVVAIVGIGGMGKTALAQRVYNDEAIKRHFELMKWVCVADESTDNKFNFKRVAEKIIGQKYDEMDQVVQELRNTIEGKRFLLVLDDVWNKERKEWVDLENILKGGIKGSVIFVTTRSKDVAQIMITHSHLLISIEGLNDKNSWELFCREAFREGKELDNQELVDIGRDIVGKCAGVPLAIRTIGSLLYNKKRVSEWLYFRNNELAKIEPDEGNRIFSILKLSYDQLPSHLKNCFAFCSLFPKDYNIEIEELIRLWMAEGFIHPLDKNRRLEDVGEEYFMQLLSRCLFQDVMQDDFGDILTCKMHDLIHDLAQSVSKTEYFSVTSERLKEENIGDGIRHMSFHFLRDWKVKVDNVKTKNVRTILDFDIGFFMIVTTMPTFVTMKKLRVLDLHGYGLEVIPKSIEDLKHLRYLDLSENVALKRLPRRITRLHNLLTLKLNYCGALRELPKDVKRLVRLRHLELYGCDSLVCMPCGLGSLTNIQTLTHFVVGERKSGGARVSELRNLIWLRGRLEIEQLQRLRSNIKEVESSKFLIHTQHLESLFLHWVTKEEEDLEEHKEDEMILEALEPHHTIKLLSVMGFQGKQLSEWICSLTSLQSLSLEFCDTLASLPESIGNLISLQYLYLWFCPALASLSESIGNLTSLQELRLDNCHALASLPNSLKSLTSLKILYVSGCSALTKSYGWQLEGFNWPALAHIPNVHIS